MSDEQNHPAAERDIDDGVASWLTPAAVYGGAALLSALIYQNRARAHAEASHPPLGRFLDVGGTTLHYTDIGEGPPIVFLHGIGTTLEDWFISPLLDLLLPFNRLIAIDRPGYGYSKRPESADFAAPERQARAIAELLHRLGAHDALVVGHSYGVLPAIALALQHDTFARALVLMSGVYYPGSPLAVAASASRAVPIVSPIARATLAPSLARGAIGTLIRASFEPAPVPQRFADGYPTGLVTRPSQIAAQSADGAALDAATARFAAHYRRIACPVTVLTGSGDAIIDPDAQSRRFAQAVDHARLIVVPGAGHMVHHTASARVAAAIVDTANDEAEDQDPGPAPDMNVGLLEAKPDGDEADAEPSGDQAAPRRSRAEDDQVSGEANEGSGGARSPSRRRSTASGKGSGSSSSKRRSGSAKG